MTVKPIFVVYCINETKGIWPWFPKECFGDLETAAAVAQEVADTYCVQRNWTQEAASASAVYEFGCQYLGEFHPIELFDQKGKHVRTVKIQCLHLEAGA